MALLNKLLVPALAAPSGEAPPSESESDDPDEPVGVEVDEEPVGVDVGAAFEEVGRHEESPAPTVMLPLQASSSSESTIET